jgi:dissimilatory sulfite reductase (desulfoviridin) alpha/beta subunit
MSLKSVNKIINWIDNLLVSWKKYRKRRYEDKISKAIDDHDIGYVNDILHDVRKKRDKRHKSS